MDMGHKLALHRLAGGGQLCHTEPLPEVQGLPIIALAQTTGGEFALAVVNVDDGVPGAGWGMESKGPLLIGSWAFQGKMTSVNTGQLVQVSTGNAFMIGDIGSLNGQVSAFGKTFWNRVLGPAAPLIMAEMRGTGVTKVEYTDLYLVTPLNLRLLKEVIVAMPGRPGRSLDLYVRTAHTERTNSDAYFAHHAYPDDQERLQVIRSLFPGVTAEMQHRTNVPHARSLRWSLTSGRRVTLFLDQGFGAWRSQRSPRHRFGIEPAIQAQEIMRFECGVEAANSGTLPMFLSSE